MPEPQQPLLAPAGHPQAALCRRIGGRFVTSRCGLGTRVGGGQDAPLRRSEPTSGSLPTVHHRIRLQCPAVSVVCCLSKSAKSTHRNVTHMPPVCHNRADTLGMECWPWCWWATLSCRYNKRGVLTTAVAIGLQHEWVLSQGRDAFPTERRRACSICLMITKMALPAVRCYERPAQCCQMPLQR